MYSFSIVVIENLYIQTSLMVALSLFRVKERGGPTFINQRWTLTKYGCKLKERKWYHSLGKFSEGGGCEKPSPTVMTVQGTLHTEP